jgi:hypothetical protein
MRRRAPRLKSLGRWELVMAARNQPKKLVRYLWGLVGVSVVYQGLVYAGLQDRDQGCADAVILENVREQGSHTSIICSSDEEGEASTE